MARTFRRKGKEPIWLYERHYKVKSSVKKKSYYDKMYYPIYFILLPKQEWTLLKKDAVRYHNDAWNYTRFKPWVKRIWAKKRRQHDRQEMAKMAKEEYEPNWFQTQIDTWWWD